MITNKRILVTGSEGFIGSHLANYLAENDNIVFGVDIADRQLSSSKMRRFIKQDLTKQDSINTMFSKFGELDYVFHLAADMGGMGYQSNDKHNGAQIMSNNQLMCTNMLQFVNKWNPKAKYFYSSSACVYPEFLQSYEGIPEGAVINLKESDAIPAQPDLYYGWQKLYAEKEVEAYRNDYELDTYVARFHNVYGPGLIHEEKREKAPMQLSLKVFNSTDGKVDVWGDGKAIRSYMYISDCVDGIIKLVESGYHNPINLGSDEAVSVDELVNTIMKVQHKQLTINHVEGPQGVRSRNSDNSLAAEILKWTPPTKLEAGLTHVYNWLSMLKQMGRL